MCTFKAQQACTMFFEAWYHFFSCFLIDCLIYTCLFFFSFLRLQNNQNEVKRLEMALISVCYFSQTSQNVCIFPHVNYHIIMQPVTSVPSPSPFSPHCVFSLGIKIEISHASSSTSFKFTSTLVPLLSPFKTFPAGSVDRTDRFKLLFFFRANWGNDYISRILFCTPAQLFRVSWRSNPICSLIIIPSASVSRQAHKA